jgi:hypothetical protein
MVDKNEDNITVIEAAERKSERSIIDFKSYETVCNYSNEGSRRRGILSEELYGEIIDDKSTGFIKIGGCLAPALIDISHGMAMGYDVDKCKELASDLSTDIKILSLPIDEFDENEKRQFEDLLMSSNGCALYFSDHNGDESKALGEILGKTGIGHAEKPLIDSRAAKGDEQAAMYLYSCYAEQNPDRGERQRLRLSDVQEYYDKYVGPSYTPDGDAVTTLNMGDRLSSQQAEEMWCIFDDMFNFLGGENHPISMQDSKEDFMDMLCSDRTMISATYKVGEDGTNELTCFTYLIDKIDDLYWLNQDFFKKNSDNNPSYVTDIYTPGLVSKGGDRMYAPLAIGFFTRVADESGLSVNMTFENTNLSKRYVPRIVDHSMNRECKHMTYKPSQPIDKETYRLWTIKVENG